MNPAPHGAHELTLDLAHGQFQEWASSCFAPPHRPFPCSPPTPMDTLSGSSRLTSGESLGNEFNFSTRGEFRWRPHALPRGRGWPCPSVNQPPLRAPLPRSAPSRRGSHKAGAHRPPAVQTLHTCSFPAPSDNACPRGSHTILGSMIPARSVWLLLLLVLVAALDEAAQAPRGMGGPQIRRWLGIPFLSSPWGRAKPAREAEELLAPAGQVLFSWTPGSPVQRRLLWDEAGQS